MDPDLMRKPLYQILREIRMRALVEGILTPNVALILTCDNPRDIGMWNTRKVFAGETWYLQKMGHLKAERNIPVVYKCPCGQRPCLKQGPKVMVDFETMPTLNWPLWRNKQLPLAVNWLPPVFGLIGADVEPE